jgi:hypothetical protein
MAKQENSASDMLIQLLTMHQSHLRAFVLTSLGDLAGMTGRADPVYKPF